MISFSDDRFRAYLQGIETQLSSLLKGHYSTSFEPTYKELKPSFNFIITPLRPCFEPTYKELKLIVASDDELKKSHVSSLPTRNWNRWMLGELLCPSSGFEPTYKELKHILDGIVQLHGRSFEPTYKELKLYKPKGVELPERGFEPTYKELKR